MGRGSGGASHGGGGHSGGHSMGGRSGGGYSGSGLGGASRGRSSGGSSGYHHHHHHYHTPMYGGFYPRGGAYRGNNGAGCGGGCLSSLLVFVLVLIILPAVMRTNSNVNHNSKTEASATQRTAIEGTKTYGEWYRDDLNYIEHAADLEDGLKYFYSKTGIQPYVLFMDYDSSFWKNGSWDEKAAEPYLAQIYQDTFNDNGHMILAYFACENDSKDLDGTFYLYYGSSAFSIMDKEAESIFWSYFDANYDNLDYSIAEFMGKSFRQTADNIMHIDNGSNTRILITIVIAGIIVIFVVAGILISKTLKNTKNDTLEG